MSVWFKYAGDKDITPGHPGGVSLFNLPSAGGFPAYGTFLFTATGIVYPVAEGGYSYYAIDEVDYPMQYCDVDVKADGSGGQFYDWTTVANVVYFGNGEPICTEAVATEGGTQVEVPTESANYYYYGTYPSRIVNSDGSGSWYFVADTSGTFEPYDYGTLISNDSVNYINYKWVGDGSYYSEYYGE